MEKKITERKKVSKESEFDVYYNLHKHTFSLKSRYTGRVTGYSNEVLMEDVKFKVSEAGRQRVLREKRKNVHAFVRGQLVCSFSPIDNGIKKATSALDANAVELYGVEITYNPYKYSTFVIKSTEQPVYSARRVYLKDKKIFAIL